MAGDGAADPAPEWGVRELMRPADGENFEFFFFFFRNTQITLFLSVKTCH